MKRPTRRKLFLFAVLSLVYAGLAAFVVTISAVATCSIQPDVVATCDAKPVIVVVLALGLLYALVAVRFFRAKLNGVD